VEIWANPCWLLCSFFDCSFEEFLPPFPPFSMMIHCPLHLRGVFPQSMLMILYLAFSLLCIPRLYFLRRRSVCYTTIDAVDARRYYRPAPISTSVLDAGVSTCVDIDAVSCIVFSTQRLFSMQLYLCRYPLPLLFLMQCPVSFFEAAFRRSVCYMTIDLHRYSATLSRTTSDIVLSCLI
jgi:hypothetical protein